MGQGIRASSAKQGGTKRGPGGVIRSKETDKDGHTSVPEYKGVWKDAAGRHFAKVDGVALATKNEDNTQGEILYFDSNVAAAKAYDHDVRNKKGTKDTDVELNFNEDGNRIAYEDTSNSVVRGLEMLGEFYILSLR